MKNKVIIIFMSFIFFTTYMMQVWANIAENVVNLEQEKVETEVESKIENAEEEEKQEIKNNKKIEEIDTQDKSFEIENIEEKEEISLKENINFKGTMFIDSPCNETTVIVEERAEIVVTGWAVSNDKNASVELLLDGNIMGNCRRTSRGDVDSAVSPEYGGIENTPLAGFEYEISNDNLNSGLHIITVQEISRYGDLIISYEIQIHIKNTKYAGKVFIDSPGSGVSFAAEVFSQIVVTGWAVSNDKNASVQLLLDGNVMGNCRRTSRGDVDSAVSPEYGGTENTPLAGFEYEINKGNLTVRSSYNYCSRIIDR